MRNGSKDVYERNKNLDRVYIGSPFVNPLRKNSDLLRR